VQFILKSCAFLLELANYRLHQCFWHESILPPAIHGRDDPRGNGQLAFALTDPRGPNQIGKVLPSGGGAASGFMNDTAARAAPAGRAPCKRRGVKSLGKLQTVGVYAFPCPNNPSTGCEIKKADDGKLSLVCSGPWATGGLDPLVQQ